MALYTAFVTSLNLTPPSSNDEGQTWRVYVTADVVVLDSSGTPVAPWGMNEPWAGILSLTSDDYIVPSDTVSSARTKLMATIRPNYVPTITVTDLVRVIFLDSGSLLSV